MGFGKNTTNQAILELTTDIVKAIDENKFTMGVFLDLSKAFDAIDHDILLSKLDYYGIRGLALDWFRSYLHERTQYVDINGYRSDQKPVICGVPQGSVLGPLLFLLNINDLPLCLNLVKAILFADDTTIYYNHTDLNKLYQIANSDLDVLQNWFTENKLCLNANKTKHVLFRQKTNRRESDLVLKIGSDIIERQESVKFLGVILDETLSWDQHINKLYARQNIKIFIRNSGNLKNVFMQKT